MLDAHFNKPNEQEDFIDMNSLEHIELIFVDNTSADLIEHRHHKECMEEEGVSVELSFISWVERDQVVRLTEHHPTKVHDDQVDDDLEHTLANDLTPHKWFKDFCFTADSALCSGIVACSKSDGSEDVHHQVDPKHLDNIEWQVAEGCGTNEACNKHGSANSELEDNEFP